MNEITVLGTVHNDDGLCSSEELYNLIERINPYAIFIEAAPENLSDYLSVAEEHKSPEIKAVKKVIENLSIDIIPVDLPDDPFDNRLETMFKFFHSKIQNHYGATMVLMEDAKKIGFPFLNSEAADQINKDLQTMRDNYVSRTTNDFLKATYSDWLKWNDQRENHWINAIHESIETNNFSNTMLIVGSAHRIGLMDKIKKTQDSGITIPSWDFYPSFN